MQLSNDTIVTALTLLWLQGKWSKDEDDQLRELVGEKGSKWKEISMSLSRLPEGCRDRWRELKLGASKLNGRWSEEETAKLRELVNEYLARKQVQTWNDIGRDACVPLISNGYIHMSLDARIA